MIIQLLEIYITKAKRYYVADGLEVPFSYIIGAYVQRVLIKEEI